MTSPRAAAKRATQSPAAPAAERLFIAIWPDEAVRRQLVAVSQAFAAQGRLVPPAKLHMTLLFLGDVPARGRDALVDVMRAAAGPPFELTLDTNGRFAASRVLWLGASTVPAELAALQSRLAQGARQAGFAIERRAFRVHVTLVRDSTGAAHRPRLEPVAWAVREIVLVRSASGAGGARYDIVARVLLDREVSPGPAA